MATRSLGQLTLDIVAKIGGFERGMDAVERRSRRSASQVAREQKRAADEVAKAWSTALRSVGGAIAVREIVQAADGFKLLNARLQLVSKNTEEFARAQQEVVRISNDSRVGLEQTATLYTQMARSTQGLGYSQQELLDVTESINQALLVSGGNADSAKAALTQLSQAFASGVLRGEEFNSVSEQAPRILQAIADGLGVSIGQLREMAKQGELTSQRVIKALQSQAAVLKAEASGIPLTVGQAMTQASNALSVFIGSLDESTGSTEALAKALSEAAKFVTELSTEIRKANQGSQDIGFLAQAFTVVSQAVRILLSDVIFVFQGIWREVSTVAKQLMELPKALSNADFTKFRAISDAARLDAERARAELDKYQTQVLNPFLNSRGRGTTGGADPRIIGVTPANETVGFRPSGGGDEEKQKKAAREKVNEAEKYLESLRKQLETLDDLSVTEALLRDIQMGRLGVVTESQRAALLETAKQIDLAKEMEQIEKEFKKLEEESIERKKKLQDAGKAVYDASRTPAERLNIELARLNDLLKQGAIDWDTYSRAVFEAQDGFDEAMKKGKEATSELDKFTKQAAENIQDYFGQSLYDLMSGNFDNIGDAFIQMINRMVAEAAAAQLAKHLFGDLVEGGSGSGWFGDAFKALGGILGFSGRAAGGAVLPGQVYRVNENGPEMLEMDGRSYLMMGNRSGNVVPSGDRPNVSQHFHFAAPTSRETQLQVGVRAQMGLSDAMRNM